LDVPINISLVRIDNNTVIGEAHLSLPSTTFQDPSVHVLSTLYKIQLSLKKPSTETHIGDLRLDITKRGKKEKDHKKAKKEKKEWEIDESELELDTRKPVGEGASAVVYRGRWRSNDVAIKVLKDKMTEKEKTDFEKELKIFTSLRSAGVVLFFGVCHKELNTCLVIEWCPNGSLHTLMLNPKEEFTWSRSLAFCKQMTLAISTLHNWKPPIVHRDLKSQNLLVSHSGQLKVCDFGLARTTSDVKTLNPNSIADEGQSTLVKLRGTFQFTAPEIYAKNVYTFKADIYSLGVVFWELFTRLLKGKYEQPFSEYPFIQIDFQIIIQVAKKKRSSSNNS